MKPLPSEPVAAQHPPGYAPSTAPSERARRDDTRDTPRPLDWIQLAWLLLAMAFIVLVVFVAAKGVGVL